MWGTIGEVETIITNQEAVPLAHDVLILKIAEVSNPNGGIKLYACDK